MKLPVPPYSSVYNDFDALLMGKSTQQVKEILNALNLNIANENQTPEDHISCEIELCLLLADNQPELLARFVSGHVNLWLPLFIEKIKEHAQTQPLQLAAALLSDILAAPALYKHERRLVTPLLISSTLLFYPGIAFAYFVVFPLAFGFLTHTAPHGVTVATDIKNYLDFVMSLFLAFGAGFEIPVAIVLGVCFSRSSTPGRRTLHQLESVDETR